MVIKWSKLDPMNSYERRIVHNIIGNFKDLKSEKFWRRSKADI